VCAHESDGNLAPKFSCHTNACRSVTLLLRGANDYMLDEIDRALHDALCIVKRVLETNSVVPGGGAVEAALSIFLENFADMLGSREQLAIHEFAQAMLVIPKTLAVNAAKDAIELVAKLRTYHNHAQKSEDKKYLSKVSCACFLPVAFFHCNLYYSCELVAWLCHTVTFLLL
jgi:T-complex protein 1 subunit alpha